MHPVNTRENLNLLKHDGLFSEYVGAPVSWKGVVSAFLFSCFVVVLLAVCMRLLGQSVAPISAQAATYLTYDAMIMSFSAPRELAPGMGARVTVTFKNIGSSTWSQDSKNFVSIYRWDPLRKVEQASVFSTSDWETKTRAVRLPVSTVTRDKETTFSFPIQAPQTPGQYKEEFILTAEDAAWIKNGRFSLDINVKGTAIVASPSPSPSVVTPVSPVVSTQYAAEIIDQGGKEWQLEMEEQVSLPVKVKNTGSTTWYRDGDQAVYLYAVDQGNERASAFKDGNWNGARAATLKESVVKQGQVGTFVLNLRTPRSPGAYKETFALMTAKKSFVAGSQISFPIKVPMTGQFLATQTPVPGADEQSVPDAVARAPKGAYAATLLLRSQAQLTLLGNGAQEMTVAFKNTGTSLWSSRSLRLKGVQPALSGTLSSVRHESWATATDPVQLQGSTKVGELGFLTFRLKAPTKKGVYTASFQLYADGQQVEGGVIDIPITVTADGYIEPERVIRAPSATQPSYPVIEAVPLNGDVSSLPAELTIRVGLYRTVDDRMVVRAKFAPLQVMQGGQTICPMQKGDQVAVYYDRANRLYQLSGACQGQSSTHYVVRAVDGVSPMEMTDYSRPVSGTSYNDNTFRTQLELRYTPATEQVWVINELPIEWYLKGIGETSNISPQQFQRTLLTAARTYAVYHVQRGTKHADEYFTVDAHLDQVYRGHGHELRSPNIVNAIDATRGQIVTYNGKLAITPYFSRSDGRTRSWGEVWYGQSNYPWLLTVPVPQDQGRTLWGHGVGMSATGALDMANEGKTYDQILKHFYTGIELRRAYK